MLRQQYTNNFQVAIANGASNQCAAPLCGSILYADTASVPAGWILHWHVDCGGYCPECALKHNEGDVEKARMILTIFSPSDSNHREKK